MMMMMIDRPLSTILLHHTLSDLGIVILSCVVGIISPTDLFGGFFLLMVPLISFVGFSLSLCLPARRGRRPTQKKGGIVPAPRAALRAPRAGKSMSARMVQDSKMYP
jgi:hypothetical protein